MKAIITFLLATFILTACGGPTEVEVESSYCTSEWCIYLAADLGGDVEEHEEAEDSGVPNLGPLPSEGVLVPLDELPDGTVTCFAVSGARIDDLPLKNMARKTISCDFWDERPSFLETPPGS